MTKDEVFAILDSTVLSPKRKQQLKDAVEQLINSQQDGQPPVSGSLHSVDPLDDENSEIHKIGREIAEMSDDDFEENCKALEKMLKGSKGNDANVQVLLSLAALEHKIVKLK